MGRPRCHRAHDLRRDRQIVPDDPVLEEVHAIRAEHPRHDLTQCRKEERPRSLRCLLGLAANPVSRDLDLQGPAREPPHEIRAEPFLSCCRLL